jgi:hypothetical protein
MPRGEGDARRHFAVEHDLEGVLSGARQRDVEDEHCPGFYVDDARRRLAELHRPFTAYQLVAGFVDEADPDGVHPDFRAAASHSEHEMGAGADRRKIAEPDMLKNAKHAQLALLIDEGVVGDEGKIEMQLRTLGWR